MEITIKGHMYQDVVKTPEEIYAEIINPLCVQFRLHGLNVTSIDAEGLGL
jgi:hypothetical protein